jgi:hypothetical protein
VVIGAQSMIYLVVLLHMLNMGVQVEICARESHLDGEQQQKTNEFLRHFIYHLNVIFLQRVFEALNSVFSYSKTTRTECTKVHFVSAAQIKELREIFLMV